MRNKEFEDKKKRSSFKTIDELLEEKKEPYSSIIKILYLAPKFDKKFELLKTRELRELIVKEFKISERRQDDNRYPLFLKFKKELSKYSDIELDQDIKPETPEDISTSSDYARFESYLSNLEKKGFIERPTRGYCRLAKKFLFTPLKNWIVDIVENCPVDNTATWDNSIIFSPAFSVNDLTNDEIIKIKGLIQKSNDIYSEITGVFQQAAFRKGNKIWNNFMKKIDCMSITKFYYWLMLIEYYYILGSKPLFYYLRKKNYCNDEINEINDFKIQMEINTILKNGTWVNEYEKDEFKQWRDNFIEFLEKAFIKYVKSSFSSSLLNKIEKQFKKEYQQFNDLFYDTKQKIILEMGKIEFSMMISFPNFLTHDSIKKLGIVSKDVVDFDQAIQYMHNIHPFIDKYFSSMIDLSKDYRKSIAYKKMGNKIEELINKHKSKLISDEKFIAEFNNIKYCDNKKDKIDDKKIKSFFENSDFFKDFENIIINLGYKDRYELYNDLRIASQVFDKPDLN